MDTNSISFRILVAIALFFLFQLFLLFSKVEKLDDGKMVLEAEVESLERKRDLLRMRFNKVEREIFRSEKRLQQLEIRLRDHIKLVGSGGDIPMIYFITPTHFRPAQRADLTRLSQTLAAVPNLHWIVVEDADYPSLAIEEIIRRSGVLYAHINAKTPLEKKLAYSDPNWKLPRGVAQRNAALAWIRKQLSSQRRGVVYFGDDDNVYDWRLFAEMRSIQRVGIWPVGLVGGLIAETPILSENGTIMGFNAAWKPERPFPIDMAAFAVNISLVIANPEAAFAYDVPRGYQESHILTGLGLTRGHLEPKADLCTKVYVWHTRTESTKLENNAKKRIISFEHAEFSPLEADALGLPTN